MQKIVDYVKQYIGVISIVLAVCILLTYSLSNFKINIESKKVAEMYIGELKYTMTIDGKSTNRLIVPAGETIVNINLTNQNEIKTYYKFLYSNNDNISISYYDQTKNTNDEITSYKAPSDSIENKSSNNIKLKIINNSTSDQGITFKVSGGYSTNTLQDVEVPNTYTEITTLETPSNNTYFCDTSDEITNGLSYVNGQYTYTYFESVYKGWTVKLTDKASTDPVTSKLCTYINNKPINSMEKMFYNSKAQIIDLSSFNTSNVTNMSEMFDNSSATTLDLSSFDTSNVTNMFSMFSDCAATTIDLSSFNTSKVTDMRSMFRYGKSTTLDVSSFDTSNVTNMGAMFYYTKATTLDLSKFNTSNVTNMSEMFSGSAATTLNLSNFNTSKVTDMSSMFYSSKATSLNLSSFDTSKVTDMGFMFYQSYATTLDLSNFNTSNVTDMGNMFNACDATTIDLSSFDTSNVTNMYKMFYYSDLPNINLSNFDTRNVTNMGLMFNGCDAKTIDLSSFDTSNVIDMNRMFLECPNLTTIYASDKFVTTNVIKTTSHIYMFTLSKNIVGGAGTKYDPDYTDKTYARIDGGTSNPGYFTLKS